MQEKTQRMRTRRDNSSQNLEEETLPEMITLKEAIGFVKGQSQHKAMWHTGSQENRYPNVALLPLSLISARDPHWPSPIRKPDGEAAPKA